MAQITTQGRPMQGVASVVLTTAGTAAVTSVVPVPSNCLEVRLVATQPCYVKLGPAPTATTTSAYLQPNWTEQWRVDPGDFVSVMRQGSNDTTLNITFFTR